MHISKSKLVAGLFTAFMTLTGALPAALALSGGQGANVVLNKMNSAQKNAYFAGVIEGLAYARYVNDGKDADLGMSCILDWYNEGKDTALKITLALRKFDTYSANAIIAALVAKQCGD